MKRSAFPADSISFFAALRDSIVVTTPEATGHTIVWVSPGFTRLMGYEPADVIGRSPRMFQGERTDRAEIARLRAALAVGRPFDGRTYCYRKDGTGFLLAWRVDPLLDDAGKRTHWMALQRDASEEAASPPLAERLGLSFSAGGLATVVLDTHLRVLALNMEAGDLLGEASVGTPFLATPLAPRSEGQREELRVALLTDRSLLLQFSVDHPRLGPRVLELHCSPLRWPGTAARATLTLTDATDRRRIEQIAAGVSLSDNIGHAFAGIRHELGNPVNSLKSAVSLLRSEITSMSTTQVATYLEAMEKECSRMDFLLRSLRNFSSLDSIECQSVSVPELVSSFERVAGSDARRRGFQLDVEVSPACGDVWADERAVFQVLLNLTTNAIDACEGVAEPQISLRVTPELDGVRFDVRDNGAGIPAADRDKLSRPFFTTKRGGTGLGLAMSQRLVSRMGGALSFVSELGTGSTFSVLLPDSAPSSGNWARTRLTGASSG